MEYVNEKAELYELRKAVSLFCLLNIDEPCLLTFLRMGLLGAPHGCTDFIFFFLVLSCPQIQIRLELCVLYCLTMH